MTNQLQEEPLGLHANFRRALQAQFDGEPDLTGLCAEFLSTVKYDRRFVTKLLAISAGARGDSWNVRLLATLMLANQCRQLQQNDEDEFKFLFRKFGILSPDEKRMDDCVLREGYTSTEIRAFIAQFLVNLSRLDRVHRKMCGRQTTPRAFDDFISVSREPCKLSLARYLFSSAEVANHLRDQMEASSGIRSSMTTDGEREAKRGLASLPDYEKGILQALAANGLVYWVSSKTSSEINSLVENPIQTVACVVKPPGSPLEFEIKRTGLRARYPLTARFTSSSGEPLPPSHRLHGGAVTASLRWESTQAAKVSDLYRFVHGCEAPVSKLLSLTRYTSVPIGGEEVNLVDYFTDPFVFGDSYANMRAEMARCVSAFDEQYGDELSHLPGEVGLTGRFLVHAMPCQGIFTKTSAYRLDTLAAYLSPTGAEAYFLKGLRRAAYSRSDAKHFADSLLDEVLGIYTAPDVAYSSHAQYLRAAFAIPENRKRADYFHDSTITALGMLWGTLLALGAYSVGESFVGRNVGLKSCFENGDWTVKLYCMDHDNLHIVDEEEAFFWPHPVLRASVVDECFICANPGRPKQVDGSSVWYLEQIYNVEPQTRQKSKSYLHRAMEKGYKQTRRGMNHDPRVKRLFSKSYIRHMHDWDVIVADYLTIRGDTAQMEAWKARTVAYLSHRKLSEEVIANYLTAVQKHDDVIERYSFLYLPATDTAS
ncbi:MAG: hypothetical protein JO151_16510 [Verrucomicrobia bacterium]|nr:hypothetical protein [Verrucomicrobiota bacterium]